MVASKHVPGLWIPCPLCYEWMKWSKKANGYECRPCLDAARAAGWSEDRQLQLALEVASA